MALETGSYISDLNSSNPQSSDSVSQADDHIRLIKAAVKATFPNITGPVTATQGQLNQPIPAGLISLWSGAVNAIPTGWVLCNGSNGTPDLRDRFIVGAGSTYAVGNTGGAASVTLTEAQIPSHTHSITASTGSAGGHTHTITDPGHTHAYYYEMGTTVNNAQESSASSGSSFNTSSSTTGITIDSAGAHTHSVTATAASTGGSGSHENRPPYYALAYIMKT